MKKWKSEKVKKWSEKVKKWKKWKKWKSVEIFFAGPEKILHGKKKNCRTRKNFVRQKKKFGPAKKICWPGKNISGPAKILAGPAKILPGPVPTSGCGTEFQVQVPVPSCGTAKILIPRYRKKSGCQKCDRQTDGQTDKQESLTF